MWADLEEVYDGAVGDRPIGVVGALDIVGVDSGITAADAQPFGALEPRVASVRPCVGAEG